MSNVSTTHPEYTKWQYDNSLTHAACEGESAIKRMGQQILPPPDLTQQNDYDTVRYNAYLARASFMGVTGRTQEGLTGAAFRKSPEYELPPQLEYLRENANGAGEGLDSYAKSTFSKSLCTKHQFLLADYPQVEEEDSTLESDRENNRQASIKRYPFDNVINWKFENINGIEQLALVVLTEGYNDADKEDEFAHIEKLQHRVLRLRNGAYTQQLYRDNKPFSEEFIVTDFNGNTFDFIPGDFLEAEKIPLYDIAIINTKHYVNSADLEESAHIHGQPTFAISSSMSHDQWKEMNGDTITVGSRAGLFLGDNGNIIMAQAEPNQLLDGLMERKEEQMIALGAKLIEKRSLDPTATQAIIDASGESSVLSDLVDNCEDVFTNLINWCGRFMGVPEEAKIDFDMNREFFPGSISPQAATISMQGYDRKLIPADDMIKLFKQMNIISDSRDVDDVLNEADDIDPIDTDILNDNIDDNNEQSTVPN